MRAADAGKGLYCGKEPVLHICWTWDEVHASFTCEEHGRDAIRRWDYFQYHEVGADCGMPGSVWDADTNRCVYEDGLPMIEKIDLPEHEKEEVLV